MNAPPTQRPFSSYLAWEKYYALCLYVYMLEAKGNGKKRKKLLLLSQKEGKISLLLTAAWRIAKHSERCNERLSETEKSIS